MFAELDGLGELDDDDDEGVDEEGFSEATTALGSEVDEAVVATEDALGKRITTEGKLCEAATADGNE